MFSSEQGDEKDLSKNPSSGSELAEEIFESQLSEFVLSFLSGVLNNFSASCTSSSSFLTICSKVNAFGNVVLLFWWWFLHGFINLGSKIASPNVFTKIIPQQTFFFFQNFRSIKSETFGPFFSSKKFFEIIDTDGHFTPPTTIPSPIGGSILHWTDWGENKWQGQIFEWKIEFLFTVVWGVAGTCIVTRVLVLPSCCLVASTAPLVSQTPFSAALPSPLTNKVLDSWPSPGISSLSWLRLYN